MEHKHKITVLVALQIILIVASFLIIVNFESQTNLNGNVVNVAGKNRLLTSQVQIELNRVLLHDPTHEIRVVEALEDLENNILFLRYGGQVSNIEIRPLAPRFEGDWNKVWDAFEEYKTKVSDLVSSEVVLSKDVADVEQAGDVLVHLSNVLTDNLGKDVEKISSQLVLLQIVLGLINVITHIFMITLIWRIFNYHTEQKIKMERFAILGEFAAMMAHDMRNPLGIIRNSVTLIHSSSGDDKTISEETRRMNRAIKRMSHQIEGVLNYVRTVPFVLEPASILEILTQSVDNVHTPDIIRITVPDKDATIQCDAEKLEFVFTNILLNAVQAIGNDRGDITIRLEDKQSMIVLSFENSGSDIPKDDVSRLFDPLFTTKMQGTGLGLTSSKKIIERHGGTIIASNAPVTFTIHIPKQRADGVYNEEDSHS